jgi:hypothetical protein
VLEVVTSTRTEARRECRKDCIQQLEGKGTLADKEESKHMQGKTDNYRSKRKILNLIRGDAQTRQAGIPRSAQRSWKCACGIRS